MYVDPKVFATVGDRWQHYREDWIWISLFRSILSIVLSMLNKTENNNGGDFIAGLKVKFLIDFENETNVFIL